MSPKRRTHSHPGHASHGGHWIKKAALHTLTGSLIGVITAALIVWLSYKAFPQIAEYSTDLGIRLEMALDRLHNTSPTLNTGADGLSFVFLDVDPDPYELPVLGPNVCQALSSIPANSPNLSCKTVGPLNCSAAQPVSRYVLSQLVHGLRMREAKQVILDVTLSADSDSLQTAESECLKRELKTTGEKSQVLAPVIYAAPVEPVWQEGESVGATTVTAEPSDYPGSVTDQAAQTSVHPAVVAAIAFPSAEASVRTYPKCFEISGTNISRLSLPFKSASLLRGGGADESNSCANSDDAPRVLYTLPHLRGYADGNVDRAEWAYYRKVYDRCLAAKFWDDTSACSSSDTYRGKVVIIGASNPARRDWHYTPIGNLVGAEIVINAVRSAAQHPDLKAESAFSEWLQELKVLFYCSWVWFMFYLIKYRATADRGPGVPSPWRRFARGAASVALFLGFLVTNVILALYVSNRHTESAPSVSVLIPVLAISVEHYAEAMRIVHEWIKHSLGAVMGLHE